MNRHKRLKKLEEKKRHESPVKVFVLGSDEPEPEHTGRKFIVRLAYTMAELEERLQ